MINFFNLIRWKNLLLIVLVQILIKYTLIEHFTTDFTLNTLEFIYLVLATVCIASGGNIINDLYDIETDLVNKPANIILGNSISEKTALNLFIIFNVIGVGLGFYLSNLVGKSGFSAIFVIISALLYIYATYLKQTLLIGNIVISVLVALSIIIVGLFDLLPAISFQNQQSHLNIFKIILDYSIFAFFLNLLREIIKDIEDINGDYKAEMKTLPILIGRERTIQLVFILSFSPLFAIIYYITTYWYKQPFGVVYFLVFVVSPLIYFTIKAYSASSKRDLQHLSNVLKLAMLFGVLSLLLYPFLKI